MKLTTLFLFLALMQASASGYSQITLNEKSISIQALFNAIEKQSSYIFLYNSKDIENTTKISIDVKNSSVDEILKESLKNMPLTYKIVDGTVLVKRSMERVPALQQSVVSGTVKDFAGAALAGVSVKVKGSSNGTSTDEKGQYTLRNVRPDAVLTFMYLGYSPHTEIVASRSTVNVNLTMRATELTEVAISTGLQQINKNVSIGSVAVATAKDLENSGITTFDKALAGKLAGVYVRSVSGRPGETGQIIIRGVNTLTGNVEPLYVLDGMPLQEGEVSGGMNSLISNGIGNIPPENIESITILKDASAAAIYGSRAANGVIVITTKTGKAGDDYINYSGKFGITEMPTNKFNFMNSQEKIRFEQDLYNNFHMPYERSGRVGQLLNLVERGSMTREEAERQINQLGQTNTNWIDEMYRNGYSQSHNISFSGGNTKTTYYTSLNYQNSQGSLIENKFQTGGFNMKLSRFVNENLLVNFNLYSTIKVNKEGQAGMDPFKYAIFANPYEKPYNEDGSYAPDMTYRAIPYSIGTAPALLYTDFNILRELRENKLTNNYGQVRGQLGVEYNFLDGFKYTGNAAASYTTVTDKDESFAGTYRSWANNWLNKSSAFGSVLSEHNRGFLAESSGRTMDYTVRNTLEYVKKFNNHFFQAFSAFELGGVLNDRFNHFNPIYLQEYAIAGYPNWDLVADTRFLFLDLARFGGTSTRENRSASFIGSLVYSYDDRYVFNGNIRYDGVDIIGSKNQFSPLWSAAVKWNAHNEGFLKDNSTINRLVFSAGFGYRGSINRTTLPFHTYVLGTAVYNNNPLASSFSYGNPVIKWEKKKETNLGIELSLFQGRVNTEFRYFDEQVNDLLDNTATPPSVGRPSSIVNIGSLSNKGFEISARFEVVKNENWLWEIGGNITQVKNNLDKVYEKDVPNVANSSTRNIQGYPVNSWFGYKYSHVDPDNGNLMVFAQKKKTELVGGEVVTSYTDELVDLSNTSTSVLQNDYATYYLGHRNPDLYGGFSTRVSYKSFELQSTFVLATGNQIMGFRDRREGPSGNTNDLDASRTNRLKENLNRWSQAGDISDIPLYKNSLTSYSQYLISTDVEKGDYFKCNDLSISWRAPRSLLAKTAFKTLKATLVTNNLFTFSNYSGTDAETQTTFGYPNTRAYTLSLSLGF